MLYEYFVLLMMFLSVLILFKMFWELIGLLSSYHNIIWHEPAWTHKCCDKTDMNKPFLIKNIKQRKLKQIRNNPITTHITPKRTSTSIGPGDQSEEACRSVMIDRHQVEGDTTEKNHRDTLTSTHRPKISQNKQQNTVTAGITTNQHTTHLEVSNHIYPVQGSFTLPCIPFSSLSSLRLVDRGFCI